ncbi:hypothetical protein [Streptomyces cadmiisoli]|uniref:hypothetical protein n=1 Tax=Streptomyces cadmiisoli TaxID=2184053 RepID=UPI003651F871
MSEPRHDLKVSKYWGLTCDARRHNMPHPGDTCDEADEWIRLRDQIFADFMQRAFTWAEAADRAGQAIATFAQAFQQPTPEPPRSDVQRALDVLAPHLAWEPRYRP